MRNCQASLRGSRRSFSRPWPKSHNNVSPVYGTLRLLCSRPAMLLASLLFRLRRLCRRKPHCHLGTRQSARRADGREVRSRILHLRFRMHPRSLLQDSPSLISSPRLLRLHILHLRGYHKHLREERRDLGECHRYLQVSHRHPQGYRLVAGPKRRL